FGSWSARQSPAPRTPPGSASSGRPRCGRSPDRRTFRKALRPGNPKIPGPDFVAGAGFEPATSGTRRARDVPLRKGLESAGSTLVSREISQLTGAMLPQPRWRHLGVAGPVGTESVAFLLRGSNRGGTGR